MVFKQLRAPTLVATIYLTLAALTFVFAQYILDKNSGLSNILGLMILPILVFSGTFHTFFKMPIPKRISKIAIKISLFAGLVLSPLYLYFLASKSQDGPMLFLGLFILVACASSLILILTAVVWILLQLIRN